MLRFAPFALLLAVAPPLLAANEKPTEAEAELITLVVKHGGTAKVQSGLDAESRVAATFNKPTEAALLAVVKQPTLGSLDLRDATKITEKAFAALSQLPNLQQLYVTGGTLTADEAAAIGSLRPLQLLVLTGCKLTDAEVGKLTKLKNLKTLDLMDTAVTDKGVDSLLALTKLEELNLSGTKVTDAGVKRLLQLEGLKLLQLNNTKVTAAAIGMMEEELRASKRGLKILR